jgi:competence protein ComEC
VAAIFGGIIQALIAWMNNFIEHIDHIPFSTWNGLHVLTWQLAILYACIAAFSVWLFIKKIPAFITALSFIVAFMIMFDISSVHHKQQEKFIVYNVPRHSAIDLIAGHACCFTGDSSVITDPALRNFNLKSSRIRDGVYRDNINSMLPRINDFIFEFGSKKILVLDRPLETPVDIRNRMPVDVIILSHNASLSIQQVQKIFDVEQVIADGSNSSWKILQWKKDCEQLHLRFHSVASDGAFTMKM